MKKLFNWVKGLFGPVFNFQKGDTIRLIPADFDIVVKTDTVRSPDHGRIDIVKLDVVNYSDSSDCPVARFLKRKGYVYNDGYLLSGGRKIKGFNVRHNGIYHEGGFVPSDNIREHHIKLAATHIHKGEPFVDIIL